MERQSRNKRGYDNNWYNLRGQHLSAFPLCVNPYNNPDCQKTASQVDHIVPFKSIDDPLRLDARNLQSLCISCHAFKTAQDQADKREKNKPGPKPMVRLSAQGSRTRASQDIGAVPPVADWVRRNACRFDLERYLKTYLAAQFPLPFSPDHRRVISKAERAVLEGGLFAVAMPRGSGKTEISKGLCAWAISYGHRRFVLMVGATNDAAHLELLDGVRHFFETPDKFPLILADFPALAYPVVALDGEPRKQGGQRCGGVKTDIVWGGPFVVMPTVPAGNWIDGVTIGIAPGAGSTIRTTSITGRLRGFNVNGQRPDIVITDDPQTDESAASAAGNKKIEQLLVRAVTGLGGHGKRIAGIMPCTVICHGDAIDSILDHARHPEWDSERTKMLYQFPAAMELWEQYRDKRNNYNPHSPDVEDKRRASREATEFYIDNYEAMNAGAVVAWPDRYFEDQVDGLQRAMDFFYDDIDAFFAEGQNDPRPAELGNVVELTAVEIAGRCSGVPHRVVPFEASHLTAFIDVQSEMLFYGVCAWRSDFTGWIIDYGAWPDQGRQYFTKRQASKTLAKAHKDVPNQEGQLRAGLTALTDILLGKAWPRENGGEVRVNQCLIDSGYQAKVVYEFVRRSPYGGLMYASKGAFVGASSKHGVGEGALKPGDRRGFHWVLPAAREDRGIKLLRYDTNAYKSFVHARLAVAPNMPTSLSLYGADAKRHALVADHLTAEYRDRTRSERTGREVDEWRVKPGNPDNDLLDVFVGCAVAASMLGVTFADSQRPAKAHPAKKMTLAEMQARARGKRARGIAV